MKIAGNKKFLQRRRWQSFLINRYRYRWIIILLCFILTACVNKTKRPPNIILILADDLGIGIPGSYGGRQAHTPFIDELAHEGMKFTQAYTGNSLCTPSRTVLLTGLHSGHTALRGNTGGIYLPDSSFTLAEALKEKGYITGGFGKWGLGDVQTPGVPEKQGFDLFFGYYHQVHAHHYYTNYLWRNSVKVPLPGDSTPASYGPYIIMDEMKSFIRTNKDKPFFCFAPWIYPHTDDDDNPVIPASDTINRQYENMNWPEKKKQFAGMIGRLDADIGQVLALLKELNIDDNTIVIFCSDNGGDSKYLEDCNGGYRGAKRTFYEGGIRTPLIIRWPGKIKPETVSDLQVYFPDIMPTLTDIADVNISNHRTDGISFLPTLLGKQQTQKHDFMYWENPDYDWDKKIYPPEKLHQAIRSGDWKLLRHDTRAPWELYNITTDPFETTDVADKHPDIVSRLELLIKQNHIDLRVQEEPEMPAGKEYR